MTIDYHYERIKHIIPLCELFQVYFIKDNDTPIQIQIFNKNNYEDARIFFLLSVVKNRICKMVGIARDMTIYLLDEHKV